MLRFRGGKINFIGRRTVKTAISVLIVLSLTEGLGKQILRIGYIEVTFACIAAIMAMQASVKASMRHAKERIVGTFAGLAVGLMCLFTYQTLPNEILFFALAVVGVIITTDVCLLLKHNSTVALSVTIFISILLSRSAGDNTGAYVSALVRILETFLGIAVALAVNALILKNKYNEPAEHPAPCASATAPPAEKTACAPHTENTVPIAAPITEDTVPASAPITEDTVPASAPLAENTVPASAPFTENTVPASASVPVLSAFTVDNEWDAAL